jgi:hypothetical protein
VRGLRYVCVLLLFAGGCFPPYALRAPASDCTSRCPDVYHSTREERVACLESCPGATYSKEACNIDDPGDVVCEENYHEEGKGELSGILLGLLLGLGLIVGGVVSELK